MSAGQSAEAAAAVPSAPRVLFSSGQIVFSAFLLGPLPPLYMLASNLRAMGKSEALRMVVFGGYALVMLELVIIYFLPSRTGGGTIFMGLNFGLAACSYMHQPDWSAIARSGAYVRAGFGRFIWVCAIRTIELLVWTVMIIMLLDYMGFHLGK